MFLGPHFEELYETKTSTHMEASERIIPWLDQCRGELCMAQEINMYIQ